MKFNENVGKLAVGTEEGFVCLFEVTNEGLDFDKVLDKQEGRILCLDWHTDGKHIVTGMFVPYPLVLSTDLLVST